MRRSIPSLPATAFLGLLLAAGSPGAASGQDRTYVDVSPNAPMPAVVAPGDLVTLWVQGLIDSLPEGFVRAPAGYPWPTSLNGISVMLSQDWWDPTPRPLPIANMILLTGDTATYYPPKTTGVHPDSTKFSLGITVQIPYDIHWSINIVNLFEEFFLTAVVGRDGVDTTVPIHLYPALSNVHILHKYDSVLGVGVNRPVQWWQWWNPPMVLNLSDNTTVDRRHPKPGDVVRVLFTGGGTVDPQIPTGQTVLDPTPRIAHPILADYAYGRRILQLGPNWDPGITSSLPAARSGLLAGSVGIYFFDFVVPSPPPGFTDACGVGWPASNFAIVISIFQTFDSVGFCVDLPAPVDSAAKAPTDPARRK